LLQVTLSNFGKQRHDGANAKSKEKRPARNLQAFFGWVAWTADSGNPAWHLT